MNFGKATNLEEVDFRLPEDHPTTGVVLGRTENGLPTQIRIGATGWSNPEWNGDWYPKGCKPGDFLKYYSRQFGTIEFNTTHYQVPGPEQVERWYQNAAAGFRFCPKVPQQISHREGLRPSETLSRFCDSIIGLQEMLGPAFIQLPENFGPGHAETVIHFVERWPKDLSLHWEFRHPDWFKGLSAAERVFEHLTSRGHGMVITDVAGRRDVLHMRLTNPVVLIRFVGNDPHPTDYTRMEDWILRLHSWKTMGLESCYLFLHQPESIVLPAYAIQWAERIQISMGIDPIRPKPLPPPSGQPTLF